MVDEDNNCGSWLANQIFDSSRISIWMIDVDDFVHFMDLIKDQEDSNEDKLSSDFYMHIYVNDGSQNTNQVLQKLSAYSNVLLIDDFIASDPIKTVPNCDIDYNEQLVTNLIQGSPILRGFYDSIGLVQSLFTKIEADLQPENFRQVPGSYFQQMMRDGHSFVGWNDSNVAFDNLADQITPAKLYYARDGRMNYGGTLNSDGVLDIFDEGLDTKLASFDYLPIVEDSATRAVLIATLSITVIIAIFATIWLYRTFRVGDRWDLRTEDIIFNIKKRATVTTDGTGMIQTFNCQDFFKLKFDEFWYYRD